MNQKRFDETDESVIAIRHDGEVTVHCTGDTGDYATLCGLDGGLDGYDEVAGLTTVAIPKGSKVDCPICFLIVKNAKRYANKNFAAHLLRRL